MEGGRDFIRGTRRAAAVRWSHLKEKGREGMGGEEGGGSRRNWGRESEELIRPKYTV